MWRTARLALLAGGLSVAVAATSAAQTSPPGVAPPSPAPAAPASPGMSGPPGTTGGPALNQPATPGAVSPSNPNAASRPQVPNISGAPVVVPNASGCGTGSARGQAGC